MKMCLLFPPGWSLAVGSPHLALPLLQGVLLRAGVSVLTKDLNIEVANFYGARITKRQAIESCNGLDLDSMNTPYFQAEDLLNGIAHQFDGSWDVQLGFKYKTMSSESSRDVWNASATSSPFSTFYQERVLPWLAAENPECVGVSIATPGQLIPTFQLLRMLRTSGYDGTIVLGGNTVTRLLAELCQTKWVFDLVDVVIAFQGEVPLLQLSKVLKDHDSFERVPGAVWKDSNGIRQNKPLAHQNPNAIPTPDFSGLPVGEYWGVNYLPLVGMRGCYYGKCSFCSISYGWGAKGVADARDVGLVFDDMVKLYQRHNIRRFKFVDEAVTPKMTEALAQHILAECVQLEWEAYARFERQLLNASYTRLLGQGGLRKIYLGLETVAGSGRSGLRKNDRADLVETVLANCREAGIKVHLFCMFGFPGTTKDDAFRTVEFILRNVDLIDTVDINSFSYAKHTSVPGVQPKINPEHDWALEFDYEATADSLSGQEVVKLAAECEETIWDTCPRLVHPTYRLVGAWTLHDDELDSTLLPSHRVHGLSRSGKNG